MRRAVIVLLCSVLAAALTRSASSAEGFERHVVRGEGLSLATPASWIVADRSVSAAAIAELARKNPKLAPFLTQLEQAAPR